jgi:UDP-N-acetyl-D-galactosamine dehydrogenase
VHDPLANAADAEREYGIALLDETDLAPADAVILAVAHDAYRSAAWPLVQRLLHDGRGVVIDVKAQLDRGATPVGVTLWRM